MLRTRRLAVCRVTTANVPSAAMIFPFARDVIKGARGTSESHGCGNFRTIEKKRASSKTKSADWVQIQFGTSIAKFEAGDFARFSEGKGNNENRSLKNYGCHG